MNFELDNEIDHRSRTGVASVVDLYVVYKFVLRQLFLVLTRSFDEIGTLEHTILLRYTFELDKMKKMIDKIDRRHPNIITDYIQHRKPQKPFVFPGDIDPRFLDKTLYNFYIFWSDRQTTAGAIQHLKDERMTWRFFTTPLTDFVVRQLADVRNGDLKYVLVKFTNWTFAYAFERPKKFKLKRAKWIRGIPDAYGLYATDKIDSGTRLGDYAGIGVTHVTNSGLPESMRSDYIFQAIIPYADDDNLKRTIVQYFNGERFFKFENVGRWMNHNSREENAIFKHIPWQLVVLDQSEFEEIVIVKTEENTHEVNVGLFSKTVKQIPRGKEIFVNYGEDYFPPDMRTSDKAPASSSTICANCENTARFHAPENSIIVCSTSCYHTWLTENQK